MKRGREMAATSKGRRVSFIAVTSEISLSLHSLLLLSPANQASRPGHRPPRPWSQPKLLFSVLFFFAVVGILRSWHHLDPLVPCPHLGRRSLSSPEPSDSTVKMSADGGGGVEALGQFWQQPDGMGYVPCLNFSEQYLAEGVAAALAGRRKKYLLLNREGVLLLRGLATRLCLQKLRCKVVFHALRFSAPIREPGNKLAMRMRSKGGCELVAFLVSASSTTRSFERRGSSSRSSSPGGPTWLTTTASSPGSVECRRSHQIAEITRSAEGREHILAWLPGQRASAGHWKFITPNKQ